MSSPYVSIIIPCFNAERYIANAIRSSLEQTYPNREVIVIDDGSTDGSVDVLKTFGSSIRWETGPNRGGCAARNRGIRLAQGDRIQFLDADDWLYPQKIERQVTEIGNSNDVTPICDWDIFESNRKIKTITCPDSCDDSFVPLINGPLQTASPLHRKSSLENVGGFLEGLPCCQERDLHLRLACLGWPLRRIPEALYATRRLPGSVSSSYLKILNHHLPLAERIRELLQKQHVWTDANSKAIAGLLASDARRLVRFGSEERAKQYFQAAFDFHSSGGWETAYGQLTRIAAKIIGPVNLERILKHYKPHL